MQSVLVERASEACKCKWRVLSAPCTHRRRSDRPERPTRLQLDERLERRLRIRVAIARLRSRGARSLPGTHLDGLGGSSTRSRPDLGPISR